MSSVVYWAPYIEDNTVDWNLLYNDLVSLNSGIVSNVDTTNKQSFHYCPAFTSISKNTFLVKNPMHSKVLVAKDDIQPLNRNSIIVEKIHEPTIENSPLVVYGLRYIFFSEDDIELTLSSPYFSKSPHLNQAMIVPGKINISKWFRTVHLEFNMWNYGELEFQENEVLAYFNFNKDVKLKRFQMSDKLYKIANATSTSSSWESFVPLAKRYKRFVETKTNKIVLKEIEKNIVQ